jgi:hypothetical protein
MTTEASQRPNLSRPAVMGIASGIFFMAFFGALWGLMSAGFMDSVVQPVAFVVIGLVTLVFLALVVMLVRYARSLPATTSPEEAAAGKKIGMWFGIVFGLEALLIALTSIVLGRMQASQFIPPAIALIVGLHFLPLARLFRVTFYYITGVLLCVLALVAIIALILGLPIAGPSPYNWSLVVGIGATLILWLTALVVSWQGLSVMLADSSQE